MYRYLSSICEIPLDLVWWSMLNLHGCANHAWYQAHVILELAGRFDSLEPLALHKNAFEGDSVGDTEVLSSNIEWNIACQLLWDISDFVENGMESDGSVWMLNVVNHSQLQAQAVSITVHGRWFQPSFWWISVARQLMDADLLQPDLITVNAAIAACGLMGRWTRGPKKSHRKQVSLPNNSAKFSFAVYDFSETLTSCHVATSFISKQQTHRVQLGGLKAFISWCNFRRSAMWLQWAPPWWHAKNQGHLAAQVER